MLKLSRSIDTFFQTATLTWLYVFTALCSCLYLGLATPPFQAPDAPNHFYRAYQVASGTLLQTHIQGVAGGIVDTGIVDFATIARPVQENPDVKWTAERETAASSLQLSHTGKLVSFPNTAAYPAWNYFPQALVFLALSHSDVSLPALYKTMCLFDAAIAIALTFFAIRLSRRTRPMLYVVALLPMTLSLFASVSQDSTLIPLCFLLIALLDNWSLKGRVITPRRAFGLAALMVAISAARLPYLSLLLMFFSPALKWSLDERRYDFAIRLTWAVASAIATILLLGTYAALAGGKYGPDGISMSGQLHYLATHISTIPRLLVHSFVQWGPFYLKTFVAGLGWFDIWFPAHYYLAGFIAIAASLALCVLGPVQNRQAGFAESALSLLALLASTLLIMVGLYLAYTPVGGALILGVQGRYFVPLFPLLGLLLWPWLSALSSEKSGAVIARAVLIAVILAFPVLTFVETIHVIAHRYYPS